MTPLLRFMRHCTRHTRQDPHLRPLSNRVKSSKAKASHKDPHSCPFISKAHKAHCHTRTLSHDPFIGAKHVAARTRKTGGGKRNNGRTRHNKQNDSPQDDHQTRTHSPYTPPTSTKRNQSHPHYHSRQHKSLQDTKPQPKRHQQPTHYQKDLSTTKEFFSHKTTTNRRRNISSNSRTTTPPSANTTYPTNHRQYDHQTNSPRTSKTHKVKEDKQGGILKDKHLQNS